MSINKEKFGLLAQRMGIPIGEALDVARFLLRKQCLSCEIYSQILRRVNELGYERSEQLMRKLIQAKKDNDLLKLATIQKEIPR
jgi:hypothetical protein